MTKVLITGATGFIGRHLARAAVSQGYGVTCLVRATSAAKRLDGLSARRVCGDVTDRDSLVTAIQRQDVVFHLAGCVKAIQAGRFYEVNEQSIRNVAEACAATPARRLSSSAVLADWL
jgi:nucleoside-diphosphate-sugar epimerase